VRCSRGAGECGGPGQRSGTRRGPQRGATLWVLCAAALQTACPQLLDDDFGRAGSGEPNAVDSTPPTVLTSTPADGARGVASDARIEVEFSEPMDTRATEGAYVSRDLPARDVSFSWGDGDSVLSIEPKDPLSVASGTHLAEIDAREYRIQLAAGASDRAGNPLAPFELTFAVVRGLTQVISASADRNLSGNWRSDDRYGVEVCEEVDATICVGDSLAEGSPTYRGFTSFDLSSLPADRHAVSSATLSLVVSASYNLPFLALGPLRLEHVRFDGIGMPSFEQDARAALGTLGTQGNVGDTLSADVSSAVRADSTERRTQFRLRFERDRIEDGLPNVILFDLADARLSVTSLVP
jgi:hypothetical protein